MAGRRRGTDRPVKAVARAKRRQQLLTDRMARASTPAERLGVAADYARQVIAGLPAAAAARLADELARVLVDTARREEKERKR